MSRVFVDTNVFVYALGAEHPYREPCRALVTSLARGEITGETSVEVLQEVAHVRRRRAGLRDALARTREILAWDLPLHDFTGSDLELALELLADLAGLSTRDAVHAAIARNRGIETILSSDGDFDRIGGLQRVDPGPEAFGRLRR